MLNLDKLRTDTAAETEGAWFTLTCGMRVKVARATQHVLTHYLSAELGPEQTQALRKGKLSAEALQRASAIATARACIRDWEPVEYAGGPFPFSPENADKLLRDDSLHDIREEIARFADSEVAFRESFLKDAEKN
jgi:hypothetical protein